MEEKHFCFAKIVARVFMIECLICIVVGRNCARRWREEIKTLKVTSATTEPNTRNQNQITHPRNNQTRTLNEPFFPLHLFYNYPPVTFGNISQIWHNIKLFLKEMHAKQRYFSILVISFKFPGFVALICRS